MNKDKYLFLIDGDNINWTYLHPAKVHLEQKGCMISGIYLFGKLNSTYLDDWKRVYPEESNLVAYNVAENTKNNTDMKILSVALQKYYFDGVRNFVILSSDADMLSLIETLPTDSQVFIGYVPYKPSSKYLKTLKDRNIGLLDLEDIRGPLSAEDKVVALNSMMQSYIRYKLSSNFFNYNTVLEWIGDRFPELKDISVQELQNSLAELTLKFTPDGVDILCKGEVK